MTPLFIIPARGGSKGIPRKNIRSLGGKPLIQYTIEAAFAAGASPANLLLSTDDDEILAVGRSLGITLPYRRPDELATDTADSRSVMLHAMEWADAQGIEYDLIVLLQPTSPLRNADDIRAALQTYELYAPEIDMAVTVTPSAANPYYDIFETGEDGALRVSKGDGLITRRQDAPQCWQYNGAAYAINPESLRRMPLGAMPRRYPVVMPRERSIDLDTLDDWARAETLLAR